MSATVRSIVVETLFWFFYLFICPVATFAIVFASSWLPDDLVGALCASTLGIAILVVVFGPVYTDLGLMSWWLSGWGLTSFEKARYLIWQYAVACIAISATLIVLKHGTGDD